MERRKFLIITILILSLSGKVIAQTGTIGDPFTNLNQAANVTIANTYYFDINGNQFNTLVDESGYVLTAIDFGDGFGQLPLVSNLDTLNRGILDSIVLADMTSIAEVRISSSTGITDVTNTTDSIINRVRTFQALHKGYVDTLINQDWVGSNQEAFNEIPTFMCVGTGINDLNFKIFHSCGAFTSFTWLPSSGYQRDDWTEGEISSTDKLMLWVKGTACSNSSSTDVISACDNYTWMDGNTYTSNNITATHTLVNSQGCDSIITLDLTINSVDPAASISGFELSADNAGLNYQWVDCDNANTPINGATNQTYTPTTNGNYAVIVDNGNCTDTSSCLTIEGLSAGTNSFVDIKLYPNPAQNVINIHSSAEIQLLRITDLSGKILLVKTDIKNPKIDLKFLPVGIYFVHVQTHAGMNTLRFIKE